MDFYLSESLGQTAEMYAVESGGTILFIATFLKKLLSRQTERNEQDPPRTKDYNGDLQVSGIRTSQKHFFANDSKQETALISSCFFHQHRKGKIMKLPSFLISLVMYCMVLTLLRNLATVQSK